MTLLFLLGLGFVTEAFAQEVIFSRARKVPSKVKEYELIGRVKDGLVVHKFGDRYNELELYDASDLQLKQSRELILMDDKRSKVLKMIPLKEDLLTVFSLRQRGYTLVVAQKISPNSGMTVGKPLVLDTIPNRFTGYDRSWELKHSVDRKQYVLMRMDKGFEEADAVQVQLFDADLTLHDSFELSISSDRKLQDVLVSNEGDFLLVQSNKRRTFSTNRARVQSLYVYHKKAGKTAQEYGLVDLPHLLNDVVVRIDERNDHLVFGGFYAEKQSSAAAGYFFTRLDIATGKGQGRIFEHFPNDWVTSNKRDRNASRPAHIGSIVHNLTVKELLPRNDGGALIIGETVHEMERSIPRSNFDSNFSRQFVEVNNYYHDDIIVICLNPDGTIFWSKVLFKKQYSEGDGGYFASFGMHNRRSQLHLLFNENVSLNGKLSSYILQSDGSSDITSLIDLNDYQVIAAPRYCKQLSFEEVVIPAFNQRNEFLLMLLRFDQGAP